MVHFACGIVVILIVEVRSSSLLESKARLYTHNTREKSSHLSMILLSKWNNPKEVVPIFFAVSKIPLTLLQTTIRIIVIAILISKDFLGANGWR
jgi:hypothetical protein